MSGHVKSSSSFLIIGCGSIGKRHIANLLTLQAGSILAFDPEPERRRDVASRFGIGVTGTLEEAWRHSPDTVLITAPTNLHLPLAMEAAARGCRLFIEKPLADRMDGIPDLLRHISERKLVTLVGCNLRFHPGLRRVKDLLEDGAIGRAISARVEFGQYLPDWHPQEDYRRNYSARLDLGGGIILDAIHEIDYIRWLLGDVNSVACIAGRLSGLDIETEDTAAILLRFDSGPIGEVHLDYVQRAYSRTCQIIGEEGTVRWDFAAGTVRWFSAARGTWQVYENPAGWEPNRMYLDEMSHFLQCLYGDAEPELDAFEAAKVLGIALAAKTSAATRKFINTGDLSWEKNAQAWRSSKPA